MRVFLTTDAVGGVWDYTATLASELCEAGHAVLVAVVGEADSARLAQLPPGARVAARAYRLEWMPAAADDVRAAGTWLSTLAREWGADVAHLNQFAYAVHDFGAPTLVVAHSDVLSWLGETLGQAPGPEWAEYEAWVRAGLAAADLVVAPSAYQAELTMRHFGQRVDRVIHNGVRAAPAPPPAARHRLALTAGRAWDEAKGVDLVDAAAALLGEGGPPVHLFGPESGSHDQTARPRHLVRHGRIPHDELVDWMGRASLYVAASRYEPFGLAPLEAALRGCALVLSDIGSFRELWDGCAAFFPSGDAAALADTLSLLDRTPARRATLARAAYERAVAAYGAERFGGEYVAAYEEVVSPASTDDRRRTTEDTPVPRTCD